MYNTILRLIFIFKFTLRVTQSSNDGVSPRVLNGTATKIGQFPFLVYLSNGCTGSLISSQNVLSASHCYKVSPFPCESCPDQDYGFCVVGDVYRERKSDKPSESRQERKIIHAVVHPNSYGQTLLYDFAVLKTETPFLLNENVAVIPLAERELKSDQSCISIGFGGQESDGAKPIETDLAWFKSKLTNFTCPQEVICVTGDQQSTFPGDSGGPLIDETGKPSVHGVLSGNNMYSKVKKSRKWILEQLVQNTKRSGVEGTFRNLKTCLSGLVTSFIIQDVILCAKKYKFAIL